MRQCIQSSVPFAVLFWIGTLQCHAQNPRHIPASFPKPREWQDDTACGANSLYAMLRLLGRTVDHQEVLDIVPRNKQGSSLEDLRRASAVLGVSAEVVGVPSSQVASLPRPAILHVRAPGNEVGHFLVYCGEWDKRYLTIDGTTGNFEIVDPGMLLRNYSGYALIAKSPWWQGALALLRVVTFALYALALGLATVAAVRRWQAARLARGHLA